MTLVLLVVAGALVCGYARGGSLTRLSHLSLPGWPLVFLALAAQAVGGVAAATSSVPAAPAYVAGLIVSALLVTLFMARNRHLRGVPLIAAGFVMNAAVVVANGAMPVSAWAAQQAGIDPSVLAHDADPRHELAGPETRLRVLADVIPVPVPVDRLRSVVSAGDVVLSAGIGVLIANAMVRPGVGRRARRLSREDGRSAGAAPVGPSTAEADNGGARWRSEDASAGPARRTRRTTAVGRTPDGPRAAGGPPGS